MSRAAGTIRGTRNSGRGALSHARRWLWGVFLGVGLGLAGQLVDLDWHAKHGRFVTASDVFRAHWLSWLSIVFIIAVSLAGAASRGPSRRGFTYIAVAGVANAVAHAWNAYEHIHGAREPIFPHVLLAVSGAGILVAAFTTVYMLYGRNEQPAIFNRKRGEG